MEYGVAAPLVVRESGVTWPVEYANVESWPAMELGPLAVLELMVIPLLDLLMLLALEARLEKL